MFNINSLESTIQHKSSMITKDNPSVVFLIDDGIDCQLTHKVIKNKNTKLDTKYLMVTFIKDGTSNTDYAYATIDESGKLHDIYEGDPNLQSSLVDRLEYLVSLEELDYIRL